MNAQIRAINESLWPGDGPLELLCECGDEDCNQRVEVAPTVYASVRSDDSAFLVAAGHEQPGDDSVTSEGPTYRVVVTRQKRVRRAAPLVPTTEPLPG